MTSTPSRTPSSGLFPARARLWDRIPLGLKWAVAIVVLGFFVHVSSTSRDGSDCSYVDVGAFGFGLAATIGALIGCRQEFTKVHDRLRLGRVPTLTVAVLVWLVSAYHMARGLGLIGGPCN